MMMLESYVVEDLCKGTIIRDGLVDIVSTDIAANGIPRVLKTHDLRALLKRIGVACGPPEQELAHRMMRAAVWRARYPAAVAYKEDIHTVVLDDGKRHSATWLAQNDLGRMDDLIDKVRKHVGAIRSFSVARDVG